MLVQCGCWRNDFERARYSCWFARSRFGIVVTVMPIEGAVQSSAMPDDDVIPRPGLAMESAAVPPGPPLTFYEPTQDERTFATLAHALQMPGWWIAPLIILLTKRESRFVKFHATQVLLLQCFHVAVTITTMVIFFAAMFGAMASGGGLPKGQPPTAMFIFMPFMWLIMFSMYGLILVLSIMYSIKAGKGEWANYPVLGQLARYMLNL